MIFISLWSLLCFIQLPLHQSKPIVPSKGIAASAQLLGISQASISCPPFQGSGWQSPVSVLTLKAGFYFSIPPLATSVCEWHSRQLVHRCCTAARLECWLGSQFEFSPWMRSLRFTLFLSESVPSPALRIPLLHKRKSDMKCNKILLLSSNKGQNYSYDEITTPNILSSNY